MTKKRLKRWTRRSRRKGSILADAQVAALEKVTSDEEAHAGFESECRGYCGAQDTFHAGTQKGVGPGR